MNADGIIGANQDLISNNLYAYCSNSPVMHFDFSGTWKLLNKIKNGVKSVGKFIGGAVVGTAKGIASAVSAPFKYAFNLMTKPNETIVETGLFIESGVWRPSKIIKNKASNIRNAIKTGDPYKIGHSFGTDIFAAIVMIKASSVIAQRTTGLEIGKIEGVNAKAGYHGIRYVNRSSQIRSIELHLPHHGHGLHLQSNTWWLNHQKHPGKFYKGNTNWRFTIVPWD